MKKKMLIVGITMSVGGSEKSFLSFAEHIDYNEWDVTLLLAEKKGALLALVPFAVAHVVPNEIYAGIFCSVTPGIEINLLVSNTECIFLLFPFPSLPSSSLSLPCSPIVWFAMPV